jgi:hypothetical protein
MKHSFYYTHRFPFAAVLVLVSFLFVLCGNASAQDFKTVHPGVEYAQVDYKIGSDPLKINLLRLDLTKVRLDVHHALDAAIGTEVTSSIAKRHGVIAAINAGFFRLDTSIFAGDAQGILQIDGEMLSEPDRDRVALFIINDLARTGPDKSGVHIQHFSVRNFVRIGKVEIDLAGINRERRTNELILYTSLFHRTTLTGVDGVEVVVRNDRVRSIVQGMGSTIIPSDGYVLSATGEAREKLLQTVRIGQKIGRRYSFISKQGDDPISSFYTDGTTWALADDIVGGVPQLIRNGKIDITWQQEKAAKSFAEMRHPRTAVAKLKDGKFLMMTVDGRQPGVSVGMTLQELADYILSLGATDAMNLDGGGSTTMFLDGKVVNTTSDKEGERKVSDAIVVTLRSKSRKSKQ